MEKYWNEILWHNFGAAIDMLENAVRSCPPEAWTSSMWQDPRLGPRFSEFWYVTYHTLFWLDLYLEGRLAGYQPPAPFNLAELDPAGLLPDRIYSSAELLKILTHCREKCRQTLLSLTDERAQEICSFSWGDISFGDLLLDNMRHVQEHGAQLNMFLGQRSGLESPWVARTGME